jgi:hypothetical protein
VLIAMPKPAAEQKRADADSAAPPLAHDLFLEAESLRLSTAPRQRSF